VGWSILSPDSYEYTEYVRWERHGDNVAF
jgi:hypothetical protein